MKWKVVFFLLSMVCNQIDAQVRDSIVNKKELLLTLSSYQNGLSHKILLKSPVELGTFISSTKFFDILRDYPLEVHESYHVYNSYLSAFHGNEKRVYFFSDDVPLIINKITIPQSEIIENEINEEVKLISNRYRVYISDSVVVNNDSRVNGLYGLIEEYIAYYFSLKSSNESIIFLNENYMDKENLIAELLNIYSDYVASYFEFSYFIEIYLDKLNQIDKELFEEVTADKKIIHLYNTIKEAFKEEIILFNKLKDQISVNKEYSFSEKKIKLIKKHLAEYRWKSE